MTDDGGVLQPALPPSDQEAVRRHAAEFVNWYRGPDGPSSQRREGASSRLARHLQSSGSAARRATEKASVKRAKRLKLRAERLSRAAAAVAKTVGEVSERQRQRLARGGSETVKKINAVREARLARLSRGEREWAHGGAGIVEQLLTDSGGLSVEEEELLKMSWDGGRLGSGMGSEEEEQPEEEDAAVDEEEADEEQKPVGERGTQRRLSSRNAAPRTPSLT